MTRRRRITAHGPEQFGPGHHGWARTPTSRWTAPGLQQYIRGAFDPARPVAVNVIDFGSDSDRATWEAVAQATGGSYQNLASSACPDLTSAVATMLG